MNDWGEFRGKEKTLRSVPYSAKAISGTKTQAQITRHTQYPGKMRRNRCHKKRRTEPEPKALRQIKKPLRTKNIATEASPVVYRRWVKASKGSIPNPPKDKLWEKTTRTARVSRRNPKALLFGSNAWAKFRRA